MDRAVAKGHVETAGVGAAKQITGIGARLVGDFSWSIENLFNRVISGTLSRTPGMLALLREAIVHCEAVHDFGSRELFVDILEAEEEHVDFIESQFELIARTGIQNYIQLNSEPAGS